MKKILKKILEKLGLLKLYRYIKSFIGRTAINRELKQLSDAMEHYQRQSGKKFILVTGHILMEKKRPFLHMLKTVASRMPEVEFVILDESRENEKDFDLEGITCFTIPNIYRYANHIYRDDEVIEDIFQEKGYMYRSLQNINMRGRGLFYSQNLLYSYYQIYEKAAHYLKPDLVLLWSKFSAIHSMCDEVFKENGIQVNYVEYGSLPGTYGIEELGQMGESFPAREPEAFLKLPVNEQELQEADRVWDYLTQSGLNRNVQQNDDVVQRVKSVMKKDRPLIVFAGNLDYDSGIVPYTVQSQTFHSPVFQSSFQALVYLSVLAEKNDWNLVFKPHPSIVSNYSEVKIPQNVIYIASGNLNDLIDFADVVVTIMSQTAYVSCIRRKPTVMLGYNQIHGKGCVYEAYVLENIEAVLKTAIEKGFTETQQEAFRRHIAQMCKYYLYDDNSDRTVRYGQSIESVVSYLEGILK